jgi:protein-tyrosine phosphatase
MPSVLFVCTANVCRSPMAEYLFKSKLARMGIEHLWRVESAGTWALRAQPAASIAVELLSLRGINMDGHRSRGVSREMLASFDLILTMEKGQKEALQVEFSEHKDRIFLLTELVEGCEDIEDPIGGSQLDFENTIHLLDDILERGFDKLVGLVEKTST